MRRTRPSPAIVLLVLLTACTGGSMPGPAPASLSPTARPVVRSGGTFRSAIEDFGFTGGFDPTGESSGLGMAVLSQLLTRTLVGYRHVAGPAGLIPVPDLATDLGAVSPDRLTYTFTLKDGVRFGPPVDRAITSADVEYAFRRIDAAPLQAQYGDLYDGLIEGMDGPATPIPPDIPGIETPDPRTVVFHLTHPAGDFLHRLALPAAAPMPPEVAKCFRKAGDYGRDVVSSGPYMVDGGFGHLPCRSLVSASGFDPTRKLRLVRNPAYDPSTDDRLARENNPDVIDIKIESNTEAILFDVDQAEIDSTLGAFPTSLSGSQHLAHVALHWQGTDALMYLMMNVLVPPFDDVHVRRAVTLVLDRGELLRDMGTTGHGVAATSLFPPAVLRPGAAEGGLLDRGDPAAAAMEMARSRYDANGDGVCDAEVCKTVLFIGRTTPPDVNLRPVLQVELAHLGIELLSRELDTGTAYTTIETVKNLIPIAMQTLRLPYGDPFALARSLHSRGIACENQINYAEVGITEAQATECGVLKWWRRARDRIPSLDDNIEACEVLSGSVRQACWVAFDSQVVRDLAAWAPIRFPDTLIVNGPTLAKFEFDQAFGTTSLCHIAVRTTDG